MSSDTLLMWCMENEITFRTWTEDGGTYRVWLCKLLDPNGDERIKMDAIYPDLVSAREGLTQMVAELAEQIETHYIPKPTLRLVHSA